MIPFLPVGLLVAAALGILIWQWRRPSFGYSWLVASGAALVAWGSILAMRWIMPPIITFRSWIPFSKDVSELSFQMDNISWPYAFSLASLVVAVVLTAGVRLTHRSSPVGWAGSLAIAGAAITAVMAVNPLAMMLAWTVVDLTELSIVLANANSPKMSRLAVLSFSARMMGNFMVGWASLYSTHLGQPLDLAHVDPRTGLLLLGAAGLRLGIFPLHLPYGKESQLRRGQGTILRLAGLTSSLALLARLPVMEIPQGWAVALSIFTALAAAYGGVMWVASKDELNARPYWMIALAGMALVCVVRGQPQASMAWGLALILSGGVVFLYSARRKVLSFIPLLSLAALSGLPFTPSAVGWKGLFVPPFNGLDIIFILAHSFVMIGYLRWVLSSEDNLENVERWIQVVYPLGLLVLVISHWLIGFLGLVDSPQLGVWWASALSVVLTAGAFIVIRRNRAAFSEGGRARWVLLLIQRVGQPLSFFFRLDWVYSLLSAIYGLVQRLVTLITIILEGDGGVLWALVFLALLVTLAISFGGL